MRYALLGIVGGFLLTIAAPAVAPASYPQLEPATATDLSYNWAGYVATGGPYTAVAGRWIVPKVAAGQRVGADATWVGIGGVQSDDLIQAGTQAIVEGNAVGYQAWIEIMPDPSMPVPLDVEPGDEVSATITQTAPGLWEISLTNETSGDSYRTAVAYASSLSSAEWVEEMPASISGRLIPLNNFGTVRFVSASARAGGKTLGVAEAGGLPLSMITRTGQALAVPSVLSESGGFIVSRSAQPAPRR